MADTGKTLRLSLGEVGCRNLLKPPLRELLMRYVVVFTLGDVHQNELLAIHSDEVEDVRTLCLAFLQILSFPIL